MVAPPRSLAEVRERTRLSQTEQIPGDSAMLPARKYGDI